MAVGVASTRAQGQNTTRMVTARMGSRVMRPVKAAAVRAATTIQVAQRSASPTILALPASADWTSRIIRWIELSSPTFVARISKAPNWFTVPLETSSPGPLSTGRDSPVITAWLMEVWPLVMIPSTGTVSPGRTWSRSPTWTSSAGTTFSPAGESTRAVRGVRWTSFSIPARALATVRSSSRPPSCMMKATSPAAKSSPMHTEAIRARETSTSALMSKAVTRPITASSTMGTPHRTMAIQAGSKGRGSQSKRLASSAAPPSTRQATSFRVPPQSRRASSFSMDISSFLFRLPGRLSSPN